MRFDEGLNWIAGLDVIYYFKHKNIWNKNFEFPDWSDSALTHQSVGDFMKAQILRFLLDSWSRFNILLQT